MVLVAAICSVVVRSLLAEEKIVRKEPPVQTATADIQEPGASSEMGGKYYGLCGKDSIHTVEDFRRTVQQDVTLSAHFAGFKWDSARLGKLDKAIWTFVSYRNGDTIRRTSKPVRLPKGDGYISDGVRTVRTFCCNDYVMAPSPPPEVSIAEPPHPLERVDGPPRRLNKSVEWVDGPPLQLSAGAVSEESAGAIPSSLEKVSYYSVPFYPLSPPDVPFRGYTSPHKPREPIVTPEPGTGYLMGGGVAVIVLFRLMRRTRDAAGKG